MADAIARLQAAVADDERARADAGGAPRGITLHQRAWPFIQLLKRSLDADEPVVWGV
jgi:cyclopropane-fatty-acyl-phospholipid synthase